MNTEYDTVVMEVDIDTVMRFWADQYKPRPHVTVIEKKWYVDQAKGKVAFVISTNSQKSAD